MGSSALMWGDAVWELARIGRVILYDRRGCTRSERPKPYERTSTAEHADDAAALLDALSAAPAVVIGRSYGGEVAIDLALRYPDRVRGLVLLEGGVLALSPAAVEWMHALGVRMREAAANAGVDAVGEALISEALGEGAWRSFPDRVRRMFTQNGPAILAESQGEFLQADAAALATIDQPVLLVEATDSLPEFREATAATADPLPTARTSLVSGGHLINPAAPEVLAFIEEVLDGR
jgi:pimeloyl-ACP methyl ester carboxylesterase